MSRKPSNLGSISRENDPKSCESCEKLRDLDATETTKSVSVVSVARTSEHRTKSSSVTKRRNFVPRGMARQARKKAASPSKIIAYDFETTRIKKGTPRPLYLTAYGESPDFHFDGPIDSMQHLGRLLRDRFLLDDLTGARFVAWNANNFDAYFIAAALLQSDEFIMRPYLTRGNSLRGLRVSPREDQHLDPQSQRSWEFLDGMSML